MKSDPNHIDPFNPLIVCLSTSVDSLQARFPLAARWVVSIDDLHAASDTLWGGSGPSSSQVFFTAVAENEADRGILTAKKVQRPEFTYLNHEVVLLPDQIQSESAFLAWLLEILHRTVTPLSEGFFKAQLALAELRQNYEETVENFRFNHVLLEQFKTPRNRLLMEFPPLDRAIQIPNTDKYRDSEAFLEQRMDCSIGGLSGISFFVSKVAAPEAGGEASLSVALHKGYDRTPIQTWEVPASSLARGWNRLSLDRALISDDISGMIRLGWNGDKHSAPSIALSLDAPVARLQAYLDGTPASTGSIALRLYQGTPGGRVAPIPSEEHTPEDSGIPTQLSWEQLCSAEYFGHVPPDAPSRIVHPRFEEHDLLVHPLKGQISTAIIPDLHLYQVERLHAKVHLAHHDCKPVEFAMALLPRGTAEEVKVDRLFSNWVKVSPLGWGEVVAYTGTPLSGPCDLFLATRMAKKANPAYAWATFQKITFGLAGQ